MKLSTPWLRLVLMLAIIATLAVGLTGTVGRASAAASRAGHAEWDFGYYEGPYGFNVWTCDAICVATAYTWNGIIAWNYQWITSTTVLVTVADVSTDVPDGICCGPVSMDAYTNNYVYEANGYYVGDMQPNTQPNGHYGCTVAQFDAISCVSKTWNWYISTYPGPILFDHSNFIVTHDDRGTDAGGDVYYRWA